jgi:hypothetical protein
MVAYDISSIDLTLNKERMTIVGNSKKVATIRVRYGALTAEKTVVVNLPLKSVLLTNEVLLPAGQTFSLNVLGGSQDYNYLILPDRIADVSNDGTIHAKSKGKASIIVTDVKDKKNSIEIPLSVEDVKSIRSLEETKEVPFDGEG